MFMFIYCEYKCLHICIFNAFALQFYHILVAQFWYFTQKTNKEDLIRKVRFLAWLLYNAVKMNVHVLTLSVGTNIKIFLQSQQANYKHILEWARAKSIKRNKMEWWKWICAILKTCSIPHFFFCLFNSSPAENGFEMHVNPELIIFNLIPPMQQCLHNATGWLTVVSCVLWMASLHSNPAQKT